MFEIWRETCKIHFNVVVYKCKHGGDGVSIIGQSLMVISTLLLCKSITPLLGTVRFVVVYT